MRDLLLNLKPTPGSGLQMQLRESLVAAILDGQIPLDTRLPSSRQLAQTLGISRNTVTLAYQRLIDDGFLLARERSGYYVSAEALAGNRAAVSRTSGNTRPPDTPPGSMPNWRDRLRIRPSEQENIDKPDNWANHPYPFVYGQVDDKLFPIAEWRECSRLALGRQWIDAWTADHHARDDEMLVEQIRTRLLPRRGVMARHGEILITMGAQHALYLLASLLVKRGSAVGIEDPGYPDVRNIFALRTDAIVPVPVDDDGMTIDKNLKGCSIVYTTPSHQAPTTVTMPETRRLALLEAAARADALVIEDDYEFETNFLGSPSPALKSLDRDGRVIYVGSLSKTVFPGLRIGYLVGDAELIREARALRRLMIRHPPNLDQRTAAHFIALGHHDSLVRRLRKTWAERWRIIREAVAAEMPDYRAMPSNGGSSIWIEGSAGLDVARIAQAALAEGVVVEPGHIFFHAPPIPRNHFRLGFASIDTRKIRPGIARLARVCAREG